MGIREIKDQCEIVNDCFIIGLDDFEELEYLDDIERIEYSHQGKYLVADVYGDLAVFYPIELAA